MAKVVTVFRNRLRADAGPEYDSTLVRMRDLAQSMPGYLSHKTFVADDGERCTIVEFESEEAQRAWATHLEHKGAQRAGRDRFYSEYKLQVCSLARESVFPRKT
jgi:heme-degrading monooxygenase HmoA